MLKQPVTGEQILGIRKVKVIDKNCLCPEYVQLAYSKLFKQTVMIARPTSTNVVVIFVVINYNPRMQLAQNKRAKSSLEHQKKPLYRKHRSSVVSGLKDVPKLHV